MLDTGIWLILMGIWGLINFYLGLKNAKHK